ncbi:MAG: DUF885 domain-containing protein [Pseudomonadota bacterium]
MTTRTLLRHLALLGLSVTLAACSNEPATTDTSEATVEAPDVAAQLVGLYAAYDEDYLALNPIAATFRGDQRFNDQWGPYDTLSDEYAAATLDLHKRYLAELAAIDASSLTGQDRVSYEIFKLERENAIERSELGIDQFETLVPVNQMFSTPQFLVMLGSGASAQPFATPEDYDNWVQRSSGFAPHIDLTIGKMREGVELGVVQPRILMEKLLPQLASQVVDNPEQSAFWQPVANMPSTFSDEDRERIEATYRDHIGTVIVPAYERLHEYIAEEYMPHARESVGAGDVPGGDDYYAFMVRESTTADYTPEEIHEIGKREAQRIYAEMQRIRDEVGFEGDMQAFFEFLRTDPQFYFDSREAIVQAYVDLKEKIDPRLDALFDIKAKSPYVVKAIEEFRERSTPAAHYMPGTPDGSRPGIFYINTYDLSARPNYMMEALSVHEAAPGHHFQISVAQEMEDLPAFRRFGVYTAFAEGWGLYAESLGKELGLYTDPYQYFGALYADIWRANRLVVDTGLHAMGWSRQDAIDWMKSNSPITETDVVAEVERYIAIPSQALAYKIGQIKIREARTRAEEALGEDFDVREFHNQMLTIGSVPLLVMESRIDDWVQSELTEGASR